jgi:response regulator RpfG family c-di-GMP phosphodiesterase
VLQTLLLIENDPAKLIALTMILRSGGYPVLDAGSPDEAIHHCLTHPEPIELLVTEAAQDDGKGLEVVERLLELSPAMRVVLLVNSPEHMPDALGLPFRCSLLARPKEQDPAVFAMSFHEQLALSVNYQ